MADVFQVLMVIFLMTAFFFAALGDVLKVGLYMALTILTSFYH